MSTLARIGSITMPSARTLEAILDITNKGLNSFDLSDLVNICSSRIDMMLSFNELSNLGLFYEVKKPSHKKAASNKGGQYLLNAKVCAEVLLNYKPELILGKRFYRFDLKGQFLFAGFIEDESDICNHIKLQAEQVFGIEFSDVPAANVTAVEITGMQSIYGDEDIDSKKIESVLEGAFESASSEDKDYLLKSLINNRKPSFDIFAHKNEGIKEKQIGGSNSDVDHISFDLTPQYSIFGSKEGEYGWVTCPNVVSEFPSK